METNAHLAASGDHSLRRCGVSLNLANYTTTVTAERSIAEITSLLVHAGARSISFEYFAARPVAVTFDIEVRKSAITFTLPCDWRGAVSALQSRRKRYGTINEDHARNVAWRCVRDWLRAQLALIEIGSAKCEQIMLPYAVMPGGETVYQRMLACEFGHKALPPAEGGAA